MVVTQAEWQWRRWVLGEGEFKEFPPHTKAVRPDVGYGGTGQRPVPQEWWARLEEFLIKRNGDPEPPRTVPLPQRIKARLPQPRVKEGVLTRNFNIKEFACHDGRQVPKIAVPALTKLCLEYLEPMRAKFGTCHVLSGYRPRDYNARIGGAKYSQHIYELTPESVAADTFYDRGTPADWAEYARMLARKRRLGGVGQYNRSHFVHIDNGPKRDWWG